VEKNIFQFEVNRIVGVGVLGWNVSFTQVAITGVIFIPFVPNLAWFLGSEGSRKLFVIYLYLLYFFISPTHFIDAFFHEITVHIYCFK